MEKTKAHGKLIVLEGIDGAGKSSVIGGLASQLRESGLKVKTYRDPGSTELGEIIRECLDKMYVISEETELLLYLTSRSQLLHEHVRRDLQTNDVVILDRYAPSTHVYQDRDLVERYSIPMSYFDKPDLVLWLDLPARLAVLRTKEEGNTKDGMELDFYATQYKKLFSRNDTWRRVDASKSLDTVMSCCVYEVLKFIHAPEEVR